VKEDHMNEAGLPPGGHFIGGEWLFEGGEDASIDPATGAVIAAYHKGSEALADAAVDAARRAFQTTAWAQSPRLRAKVLADLLDGYITPDHARDVYGVVFQPVTNGYGWGLDSDATTALRARMRAA
jgi:hypothetical protein